MPSKRDVLAILSRDELLAIVDRYELSPPDRRAKDGLVDTVASSKRATLAEVLPELSRERLKELCRALDLGDAGKEKVVLVERLSGAKVNGAAAPVDTPASPPSAPPPSPRRAKAGEKNGGGDLGFERTLFLAADKLRNNLDAAEYKHVVLGLIFLKYISDAFEELHAKLTSQIDDGADPEQPDEYRAERVFWVPKEARWPEIQGKAKQPTIGQLLDDAMVAIERDNPSLKGVLPKNYGRPQLDKQRLGEVVDLIGTIGPRTP